MDGNGWPPPSVWANGVARGQVFPLAVDSCPYSAISRNPRLWDPAQLEQREREAMAATQACTSGRGLGAGVPGARTKRRPAGGAVSVTVAQARRAPRTLALGGRGHSANGPSRDGVLPSVSRSVGRAANPGSLKLPMHRRLPREQTAREEKSQSRGLVRAAATARQEPKSQTQASTETRDAHLQQASLQAQLPRAHLP